MTHLRRSLLGTLVVLAALGLALSLPALASPPSDPNAPPPAIAAILAKIKSGTPPTPAEQQQMREWQNGKLGAAAGNGDGGTAVDAGLLPSDLQQLMQQMSQGIAPSPADIARLRAWGAQAKGHKEDLINAATQLQRTYQAAMPATSAPRGPLSDNLVHGQLTVRIDQRGTQSSPGGSGDSHTTLTVTLPAAYKLETDGKPNGEVKLTVLADGRGPPTGLLNYDFRGSSSCSNNSGSGSASVSGWNKYLQLNPKLATGNPTLMEIKRPAGASRSYLTQFNLWIDGQGTVNSHSQYTCKPPHDENGTTPLSVNQVAPVTLDGVVTGVAGVGLNPAIMQSLAQYGVPSDPMSKSPEMKDALQSVTFQFPADGLAKQMAAGSFSSSGTYAYRMKTHDSTGSGQLTSTAQIVLGGAGPKLKAYIEPDDLATYKTKWIPEGAPLPVPGTPPSDDAKGNALKVHVSLVNTDTNEVVSDKFKTTYNLRNTSKATGWCTNYPANAPPDYWKDLRFTPAENATTDIISDDRQQLETADGQGDEAVTITSYDYGSYGSLQAEVTLKDGTKLEAELRPEVAKISGKDNALTVPADSNNNDIADAWEQNEGILGENRPANWDLEDTPAGANTGDGLTLYEEYRGVAVSDDGTTETFRRLSASGKTKKEFFLVDKATLVNPVDLDLVGAIKKGLTIRQAAANDRVIAFYKASEVLPDGQQFQMNPNSDPGDGRHFKKKHYAVQIKSDSSSPPTGEGPTWPAPFRRYASTPATSGSGMPTSPDKCAGITLYPLSAWNHVADFSFLFLGKVGPYTQSWLKEHGLTKEQMVNRLASHAVRAQFTAALIAFTVAHESGHTIGRFHHERSQPSTACDGSCDAEAFDYANDPPNSCPMHYPGPSDYEFMAGTWDLSTGLDGPADGTYDFTKPGWLKAFHSVPYHYCDQGQDDGSFQGGSGGPRYQE